MKRLTFTPQFLMVKLRSCKGKNSIIFQQPFCVYMPRAILFAYCDKLKAKLDLLQSQNIITTKYYACNEHLII